MSARDAYDANRSEIGALVDAIMGKLNADRIAVEAKGGPDYADAGSLGHVVEVLETINAFLGDA